MRRVLYGFSQGVSLTCFNCLNYSVHSVEFCVSWKIELVRGVEGDCVAVELIFEVTFNGGSINCVICIIFVKGD